MVCSANKDWTVFLITVHKDETLASLEERAKQAGESSVGGFSTKSVPEPTSITYVDYENPFVSRVLALAFMKL